jgi:hypothetical protein
MFMHNCHLPFSTSVFISHFIFSRCKSFDSLNQKTIHNSNICSVL